MPPGRYGVGGFDVESNGVAPYRTDGTLAGSASTMDQVVRAVAGLVCCGLREVVAMASLIPARVLGCERPLGRIGPGCAADIVVLDDTYQAHLTLVGGRVVYDRDAP
jgi:N-acetylglucosamine-6-phosphate deacetylase